MNAMRAGKSGTLTLAKMMKRCVAIVGLSLALSAGANVAQAQPSAPQPPSKDEFVPVNELPPQEKLPAAQFLIVAYSIVWIGVTGYVWSLWRRLGKVEQELVQVARPAAGRGR